MTSPLIKTKRISTFIICACVNWICIHFSTILYHEKDKLKIKKKIIHDSDAGHIHTHETAFFQNIFKFCTFLPNFQIFCPFLPLFKKTACMPFFLEQALVMFAFLQRDTKHVKEQKRWKICPGMINKLLYGMLHFYLSG